MVYLATSIASKGGKKRKDVESKELKEINAEKNLKSEDIKVANGTEQDALDGARWKRAIHKGDPPYRRVGEKPAADF